MCSLIPLTPSGFDIGALANACVSFHSATCPSAWLRVSVLQPVELQEVFLCSGLAPVAGMKILAFGKNRKRRSTGK